MPSAVTLAAVGVDGRLFVAAGPELWSLDSQTRAVDRRWTFDASVAAVLTTAFDTNLYVEAITTDKDLETIFLSIHAASVGLSLKRTKPTECRSRTPTSQMGGS